MRLARRAHLGFVSTSDPRACRVNARRDTALKQELKPEDRTRRECGLATPLGVRCRIRSGVEWSIAPSHGEKPGCVASVTKYWRPQFESAVSGARRRGDAIPGDRRPLQACLGRRDQTSESRFHVRRRDYAANGGLKYLDGAKAL